ncbi:hypothetical protein K474DRAFT_1660630 [Panus rudis PR-1116 ss-1]|nr:hypothetical protein K474DRAFT_1660630 [Panus rudis PR-1116 ss-1]
MGPVDEANNPKVKGKSKEQASSNSQNTSRQKRRKLNSTKSHRASKSKAKKLEKLSTTVQVTDNTHKKNTEEAEMTMTEVVPPKCHLGRVPVEVLEMILSYTASPRDILALARCSQYYCNVLVNPSFSRIWISARQRALPKPIPDPTPNFTEPAYAAFLFDSGECEICKKKVTTMYDSFTLKLRLCSSKCRKDWLREHAYARATKPGFAEDRYLHLQLPRLETINKVLFTASPTSHIVRRRAWQEAVDEYNKAVQEKDSTVYKEKRELSKARNALMLELGESLSSWRNEFATKLAAVDRLTKSTLETVVLREGWNEWDVLRSSAYQELRRAKHNCLQPVTKSDIESIRPELERHIIKLNERSERREAEEKAVKKQQAIEKYWNRLHSVKNPRQALPALSEFRKFLIFEHLEEEDITIISKPIKRELERWREKAREGLARVLGFPGWKSASKNKVHPVDRLTARFVCTRCGLSKAAAKDGKDNGLSYQMACEHRCAHLTTKQEAKEVFNAEHFARDEKAILAVQQVLAQLGVTDDNPTSKTLVAKPELLVLCKSCPSTIFMDFETMLRHCKRHDEVAFQTIDTLVAETLSSHAFVPGLKTKLMETSDSAREQRQRIVYGCRHCQQKKPAAEDPSIAAPAAPQPEPEPQPEATGDLSMDTEQEQQPHQPAGDLSMDTEQQQPAGDLSMDSEQQEGPASEAVPETEPMQTDRNPSDDREKVKQGRRAKKEAKMFSFDGLRSHVKTKHGILWIGDEDFFKEDKQD